jgi:preprotein translocase subunit SecD
MRWAIIIIVIGGALYFMLPLNEKVRLGLDLQGGMHVVLGVDTEKAVEARLDSIVFQVRRELQQEGINFSYVQKALPHSVNVGIEDATANRRITDMMALYAMRADGAGGGELRFTMESQEADRIRQNAVLQSLEVVRNRIDAFGVAEPVIQRQGRDQVLVQLPGVTDPDRAINLIGQTAQLKFYLVDDTVTMDMLEMGNVPYSSMILYERVLDKNTGRVLSSAPIAVKREVILTGDSLMDAGVQYGQFNEPTVWFRFDPAGAKIFEDITTNNVGRRLAIVLDDNVYSAPNIRERIPGGNGTISGSFTLQQAQDLAIVLRAGSLPAPVTILENRTVGPSLGADSIASGVKASLIGFLAICIFMVIYYRVSGLVANIGLLCNLVVLMGVMCLLNATLTLPGIAGIILALAIAVDANVLIFERVREELRNGRTVMNAFELGYQKAFNTIVDANVTSLIASVVLFQFGTGPVKGFAVTLSVGLIASMFTAVFVTKTIFMSFIIRNDPKKISI